MIFRLDHVKKLLFKNIQKDVKKASIIFNMKFNTKNTFLYSNFIYTLDWFMSHYSPKEFEYILIEQDVKSNIDIPEKYVIKKILLYNPQIFNRGWGYNVAVKYFMTTDVAIFCDSDIILEYPENIIQSVNICKREKKLVSPYDYVTFTSREEREKILRGETLKDCFKSDHPVTISGGIVTVNRSAFLEVGGFEEYQIYGGEDRSLDVIFLNKNTTQMLKGCGIHLYHLTNPTKKSFKNQDMLQHLKKTYNCVYNSKLKPNDFIHLFCQHKNNLETHIQLKLKYFGDIDLYKNTNLEINSFPKL